MQRKRGSVLRISLIGMVGLLLCAAVTSVITPAQPIVITIRHDVPATSVAVVATSSSFVVGELLVDACFDAWYRDLVRLYVVGDTLFVVHDLIDSYETHALLLRGAGCAHSGHRIQWVKLVGDDGVWQVPHLVARGLHLGLVSEGEAVSALIQTQ